jgi:hypothetical protein
VSTTGRDELDRKLIRIRRSLVAAAITALALTGVAVARTSAVTGGLVMPNVGAAGIKLGMTRAQVIAKLGHPIFQNTAGFMQYGRESQNVVFDVYLDTSVHPWRVRLLGISGIHFCLAGGGPCLQRLGGVGKLQKRYDGALKTVTLEDGEKVVWLKGKLNGCKVFTDFGDAGRPAIARIVMVFIGYQSGHFC